MKRQLPNGYSYTVRHTRERDPETGEIRAKGGITTVIVKNRKGDPVVAESAICRMTETYNKKLGREIALGRALKYIEKRQPRSIVIH